MAINAGDSKEINGVIFTATDSTNLKAVSIADTDHDRSVDVKILDSWIYVPSLAAGGTFSSWWQAAHILKERIFERSDRNRTQVTQLRRDFDNLPNVKSGRGKQIGSIILRHDPDGNVIARAESDTASERTRLIKYEHGGLNIAAENSSGATTPNWETAAELLETIFAEHDSKTARQTKLETDWDALPTPA